LRDLDNALTLDANGDVLLPAMLVRRRGIWRPVASFCAAFVDVA
jgi:hypothetical protein